MSHVENSNTAGCAGSARRTVAVRGELVADALEEQDAQFLLERRDLAPERRLRHARRAQRPRTSPPPPSPEGAGAVPVER